MKLSTLITFGLSSFAHLCSGLPGLAAKDGLAVRAATGSITSSKSFGDFLMRDNGSLALTSPELNTVTIIDAGSGAELSPIHIPGVQGTFGIVNSGTTAYELYFVVGGNLTTTGAPVSGSFALFSIQIETNGDGNYDTNVQKLASIPPSASKPTGSIAYQYDYVYIADVGTSSILTYQLSTNSFNSNAFPASPSLANTYNCSTQLGLDGLATGNNFTLWFSNQAQALTGKIQLDYYGVPAGGDFQVVAQQAQTQGSDPDCAFVSWGKFAVDGDGFQWIAASDDSIVRAWPGGRYATVLSPVEKPVALTFGATQATRDNLYAISKTDGGSLIRFWDTTGA